MKKLVVLITMLSAAATAFTETVHTENFFRIESIDVTAVCGTIIVFTMSPVFIALLALVGSRPQPRAAPLPFDF